MLTVSVTREKQQIPTGKLSSIRLSLWVDIYCGEIPKRAYGVVNQSLCLRRSQTGKKAQRAETAVPQETAERMDLLPPGHSDTNTSAHNSRARQGN